jgi:hypothetical protein
MVSMSVFTVRPPEVSCQTAGAPPASGHRPSLLAHDAALDLLMAESQPFIIKLRNWLAKEFRFLRNLCNSSPLGSPWRSVEPNLAVD